MPRKSGRRLRFLRRASAPPHCAAQNGATATSMDRAAGSATTLSFGTHWFFLQKPCCDKEEKPFTGFFF